MQIGISRLLGKDVILPFTPRGFDRFGRVTMYLRHRRPTKADVIVFVLHDQWFKEPLSRLSPVEQVTDALGRTSYASRDQGWQREFGHLKTEVRAWSGNAIMARKAKTVLKHALIKGLSRSGIYHHQTGLAYLPYKKTRVIVERLPETVGEIAPGHGKFDRLVAGAIRLSEIAKQEKALLLTVIIPAKEYAYNRFQPKPVPLSGYGPASRLNRALKEAGVQTVFTHPVLFEAVRRQMEDGGPAVYWNDDGHWTPYGIRLTMEMVRDKLVELGALKL